MLSVIYAECHIQALYAECQYAECPYAECRYAECRAPTRLILYSVLRLDNYNSLQILRFVYTSNFAMYFSNAILQFTSFPCSPYANVSARK